MIKGGDERVTMPERAADAVVMKLAKLFGAMR